LDCLTVWAFDDPLAADRAVPRLAQLAATGAIAVDDAAVVSWTEARRKPSMHELGALTGPGVLWGGSWGLLLGLVFLVPIAGPMFGAGAGAIAGSLSDFGIADDFIKRVRDRVTAGTSALFVLCGDASADAMASELGAADVIRCELSPVQGRRLREALGEEPVLP
jgi:uncharacterized membrane protein